MFKLKSVGFLLFFTICYSWGENILDRNYIVHHAIREVLQYEDLNTTCQKHLWMTVSNLTHMWEENNYLDELWVLKMFDASSKLPSGIMSGHIADMGAFDQCVEIKQKINDVDTIRGNYCKVKFPLLHTVKYLKKQFINPIESRGIVNIASKDPSIWLAICIPSSCTAQELNSIFNKSSLATDLKLHIQNCQSLDHVETMAAGEIVAATFFCLILAVMVASTAYDLYINYMQIKPIHIICLAFSVYTNGRKLLTVTKSSNQLQCLHGIRFFSMMWVVIGHAYFTALFAPSINPLEILNWKMETSSMFIVSATVSVDTFFVLGGLLISYIYLQSIEKGIKFNVIFYYIHRYIRLTPAFAAIVLLHVTLIKYFGFGPFWPEVAASLQNNCVTYWWSSLLYVQNYVNPEQICLAQAWYLSVDMQLFILTPLALIPLGKWPQKTLIALGVLTVISVIIPFVVVWVYEIPGLLTDSFTNPNFNRQYYVNTYTRFGPIVVGLILGYYIYDKQHNFKINALFENIYFPIGGWIASVGVLVIIVFAANNINYHQYNQFEASFYIAIHRVVWSIALSWIIYACILGYGGPINKFLSLPIFQILSRLTYCMYLIHLSFQTIKIGLMRVPINFGNFERMHTFWGDFIFTAAMAVCWTLAFESPMIVIEKVLFKTGRKKEPVVQLPPISKISSIA